MDRKQIKKALGSEFDLSSSVIDGLPDYIYVKDAERRYLLDNAKHRQFLGVGTVQEVVGKTVYDFFPKDLAQQYDADDQAIIQSGQPLIDREERITHRDGRQFWVSTTKTPLRDAQGRIIGLVGRGRDITARKRAEEALAWERHLLNTLMETTPDHIYFKDKDSRFIQISRAQTNLFGLKDPAEAVGKTDFDFFTTEHAQQAYADEQEIIRTGRPIVGKEEKETWPDGHETWASTTKVALRDANGQIIGTFGISRDITHRKVAQEQAARYAEELREKNANMEADLILARELQEALLPQQYPSFPPSTGTTGSALRFCHRYQPSAAVGGDFFDVLPLSDTEAGVFICDVMGKGVRAAMVTAMIRTLMRELAPIADDPGQFLRGISRGLLATLEQTQGPIFASAFYMVADVRRGELRYANAGHPMPFHLRRERGVVEPLSLANGVHEPALGMFEDSEYTGKLTELAAHDLILLYTDGVIEVDGADKEQFGRERLRTAVSQRFHLPPERLFDELLAEIQTFSAAREFADDVCLVGMEVLRVGVDTVGR